jgi:predicted dehydrogenase
MRIVQVGVGSKTFGRLWRRGFREIGDCQVVGLVDVNTDYLREAREYFGLPEQCCATAATPEFYEKVGAQCIVDSSPHAFHYKNAIDAMRCGLDVIVVKPMSDSPQTAETMVREAERLGRKLVVAQQIRFFGPVLEMKRRIAKGLIGEPAYVSVDSFFPRTGPVREKWYQPHPLLLECAIHQFDLIRWMLGLEPRAVTAEAWNMPWNEEIWGKKSAIALFEMNNGCRVLYRGLSTELGGESYPGRWVVEGTKGILELKQNCVYSNGERIWPDEGESPPDLDLAGLNVEVLRDALSWFQGKAQSVLSGADNLRSLKMAFACIDASERGVRVVF